MERGRWSRIARENRLCQCKLGVQDEVHILFDCPDTLNIRENFQVSRETYTDIKGLMDELDVIQLVNFVERCVDVFT